ncbi:Aste57867_14716 [Aphanomyces stellatus]|uniref:Aste57867_14716 protein n=1 Tax=Aphanomyces stellatus TaxID=120398 RepID=A0A485L1E6_9STRA|nr:hypothetical protein As57867_014661 [Aphanomyces stellatus]VFT91534.1 Aste57867_14716 [Aphanomyces stellatus]
MRRALPWSTPEIKELVKCMRMFAKLFDTPFKNVFFDHVHKQFNLQSTIPRLLDDVKEKVQFLVEQHTLQQLSGQLAQTMRMFILESTSTSTAKKARSTDGASIPTKRSHKRKQRKVVEEPSPEATAHAMDTIQSETERQICLSRMVANMRDITNAMHNEWIHHSDLTPKEEPNVYSRAEFVVHKNDVPNADKAVVLLNEGGEPMFDQELATVTQLFTSKTQVLESFIEQLESLRHLPFA